jgi:hypothetical protein
MSAPFTIPPTAGQDLAAALESDRTGLYGQIATSSPFAQSLPIANPLEPSLLPSPALAGGSVERLIAPVSRAAQLDAEQLDNDILSLSTMQLQHATSISDPDVRPSPHPHRSDSAPSSLPHTRTPTVHRPLATRARRVAAHPGIPAHRMAGPAYPRYAHTHTHTHTHARTLL